MQINNCCWPTRSLTNRMDGILQTKEWVHLLSSKPDGTGLCPQLRERLRQWANRSKTSLNNLVPKILKMGPEEMQKVFAGWAQRLDFGTQCTHKNPDVVAPAHHPSTTESLTGRCLVLTGHQFSLICEPPVPVRVQVSKHKLDGSWRAANQGWPHVYTYTWTNAHALAHTYPQQ